jgi:hypothetical protein
MKAEVAKMNLYSNVLMLITSIHHIYGAIIYDTPWRLHVLFISVPVVAINLLVSLLLKKLGPNWHKLLYTVNALMNFIFSVVLIGAYEGVYNHIFKNVAFFSGMSKSALDQLFDPKKYVLPNDFFFEFSGVAQGIVFVPLLIHFLRASKIFTKKTL